MSIRNVVPSSLRVGRVVAVSALVALATTAAAGTAGAVPTSAPSAPGPLTGYELSTVATGYAGAALSITTGSGGQIVLADPVTGDVITMNANGTDPVTIATGYVSAPGLSVAVGESGTVFLADAESGDVVSMNDDGSDQTTIATGYASTAGLDLVINGTNRLYLADGATGDVVSMTQTGGTVTTVADGLTGTSGLSLAVASGQLFITAAASDDLDVVVGGSKTPNVVVSDLDGANGLSLAANATGQLFIGAGASGEVTEMSVDGTDPMAVVTSLTAASSVNIAEASSSELLVNDAATGLVQLATPDPFATPADGSATVAWTVPSSNGGAPITSYAVTAVPSSGTPTTTTFPGTVTEGTVWGLSPSESYTFTVTATNLEGTSTPSATSNWITPDVMIPDLMAAPTVAAGNLSIRLTWTPPYDGGSPLLGFLAVATPVGGGASVSSTFNPLATSGTVYGLVDGRSYRVAITATNVNGQNALSPPSASVVPAAAPGRPIAVTAVAGVLDAAVHWVAPSNGGAPITLYTVTATSGGRSCTATSVRGCTVTGLVAKHRYQFTVTATNDAATSAPSSPSNWVTPRA